MSNKDIIAKIKAEIDKRYAEYREKMKSDDFTYHEGECIFYEQRGYYGG